MAEEKGRDFWYMWQLVQRAYVGSCTDPWVSKTVTPFLMLAISWEETEFSNVRQGNFDHADWMRRWNEVDGQGRPKRDDKHKEQIVGNHAIGMVQVERDTMDLWLTNQPRLCIGLPEFYDDMAYAALDPKVTPEQRKKRMQWWQGIDEKILADDALGMQLGWRAFSYYHAMKVAGSKLGLLKAYAGHNKERDDPNKKPKPGEPVTRTAADIIKGWLDTDACMRTLADISPYRMQTDFGLKCANTTIAGAFYFSKSNGNFPRAFGGTSREAAEKMSKVWEPFLMRGINDTFIPSARVPELREAIKAHLGIVETP